MQIYCQMQIDSLKESNLHKRLPAVMKIQAFGLPAIYKIN